MATFALDVLAAFCVWLTFTICEYVIYWLRIRHAANKRAKMLSNVAGRWKWYSPDKMDTNDPGGN